MIRKIKVINLNKYFESYGGLHMCIQG